MQATEVLELVLLNDTEIEEVFAMRACGFNTPEIAQRLKKPSHSVSIWVQIYDEGIRDA